MSEHTKGPWHVDRIAAGPSFYVIGNSGEDIARVRGGEGQSHPNAHLIAAAPDLYEASKNLRARQRDYMADRGNEAKGKLVAEAAQQLDAAIAKAEGKR